MPTPSGNLRLIIDAVLDGRATAEDMRALEVAAQADPGVVSFYVDAVNVHASLQWDHGSVGEVVPTPVETTPGGRWPGFAGDGRVPRWLQAATAVALIALAAIVVAQPWSDGTQVIAENDGGPVDPTPSVAERTISVELASNGDIDPNLGVSSSNMPRLENTQPESPTPLVADNSLAPRATSPNVMKSGDPNGVVVSPRENGLPDTGTALASTNNNDVPVGEFIDARLAERWREEGVTPSRRAEPTAWLRRASLDLKGRIPTRSEIEQFLASPAESRRENFVADALASGEYADHFATVWSNLLVGRSSKRAAHRERLQGYLAQTFAENRPWGETAGELVAATGTEENPPTNFLLAHLNNEAVPATAITSRVLLGRQLQCTQCHRHPFNDWTQDQFWELNAFFQQCDVEEQTADDGSVVQSLVDRPTGGPTFFETRRGLMQVAYPIYAGERVDESPSVRRREELARLIVTGEKTELAEAMVNRLWAHFMGAGFSREIDDLGPHAAITHPDVLDRLSREFVASGYDLKQLVAWITASAPYQLASEWTEENSYDRPEIGETPLFSRVYEKPLSPEQLYDSLVTATAGPRASIAQLPARDEWVAAFYAARENEENSEMSTFEASPSVALELMNGELVSKLVNSPEADALSSVLTMKASEDERLRALSLLVIGRDASQSDDKSLRKVLRQTIAEYSKSLPRSAATEEGFRDLFWAYVNSSEFAMNR